MSEESSLHARIRRSSHVTIPMDSPKPRLSEQDAEHLASSLTEQQLPERSAGTCVYCGTPHCTKPGCAAKVPQEATGVHVLGDVSKSSSEINTRSAGNQEALQTHCEHGTFLRDDVCMSCPPRPGDTEAERLHELRGCAGHSRRHPACPDCQATRLPVSEGIRYWKDEPGIEAYTDVTAEIRELRNRVAFHEGRTQS